MATSQRGKKYWIAYSNGQGEASERAIHVRSVSAEAHGTTHIRACCELAGEERTFHLDRMADIELLDGPLSEATRVTQRRNSSYLGPSQEVARTPWFSPPTRTAPNAQAARITTAPQRNSDATCPAPQTAGNASTE